MSGAAVRIGRAPEREFVFRSGRSAVIRDVYSAVAIFGNPALAPYMAEFEAGALSDPGIAVAICREVVRMSLIDPELAPEGEESREGVVALEDLYQDEIDELVELWQANLEAAAGFRGGGDGADGGDGGEDVGDAPKPRPRSSKGKR